MVNVTGNVISAELDPDTVSLIIDVVSNESMESPEKSSSVVASVMTVTVDTSLGSAVVVVDVVASTPVDV